jgi:hypothetical protein
MTQRQTTGSHHALAAQSSTGLTFVHVSVRSRPSFVHIPPRPARELFPEAVPRAWQAAVLGLIAVALAVAWFVRTPSVPPSNPGIAAMSRGP